MQEQKTEQPPSRVFAAIILLALLPVVVIAPYVDYLEVGLVVMQENTLIDQCPIGLITPRMLATVVYGDVFEGLVYEKLIRCMAKHESSYNPCAVGDHGTSFGCLQMHKWWEDDSYWQEWCVEKYGFDDVGSCRQQVLCADYTLQEDFNQLYGRWPQTHKLCISKK